MPPEIEPRIPRPLMPAAVVASPAAATIIPYLFGQNFPGQLDAAVLCGDVNPMRVRNGAAYFRADTFNENGVTDRHVPESGLCSLHSAVQPVFHIAAGFVCRPGRQTRHTVQFVPENSPPPVSQVGVEQEHQPRSNAGCAKGSQT